MRTTDDRTVSVGGVVCVAVLAFALLALLTDAAFPGDAGFYAVDAVTLTERWVPARALEFGHLVWRPLLVFLASIPGVVTQSSLGGKAIEIETAGERVVWMFALLAVFCFARLAARHGRTTGAATGAVALFLLNQSFLNYSQAATSYIPALALCIGGLDLLDTGAASGRLRNVVGGGAALAASVMFWFPFILAIPGVLLAIFLWHGTSQAARAGIWRAALSCSVVGVLGYGTAAFLVGVRSFSDFMTWMSRSSQGVSGIDGLPRMVLGLGRSYVSVGDFGLEIKRLLVQDPFSRPEVSKIVLHPGAIVLGVFYVFLAALAWSLFRTRETRRHGLALLIVFGVPTLAFAVSWKGGDLERYLPLLPAIGLGTAISLRSQTRPGVFTVSLGILLLCAAVMNWRALGSHSQDARARRLLAQTESVTTPPDSSLLVTVGVSDDVIALERATRDRERNQRGYRVAWLIAPGDAALEKFSVRFAYIAMAATRDGRHVWLTTRCLRDRPEPGWNWVEGADPRVRWRDVVRFCRSVTGDRAWDGRDMFVRIVPDEALLRRLLAADVPLNALRRSQSQPERKE